MDRIFKICTKCKEVKTIDMFFKDKYKRDGLTCWCKECFSKYRKEHKKYYDEYNRKYYLEKVKKSDNNEDI